MRSPVNFSSRSLVHVVWFSSHGLAPFIVKPFLVSLSSSALSIQAPDFGHFKNLKFMILHHMDLHDKNHETLKSYFSFFFFPNRHLHKALAAVPGQPPLFRDASRSPTHLRRRATIVASPEAG